MEKILLVAPAWLGDMIMAHSLLQVLRTQDPEIQIDVLAPKSTLPITELMPEFSERILMPEGHGEFSLIKRWRLAQLLKAKHYTRAYILANTWKSALVPFLARIPKRIGWLGEARYGLLTHYLKHPERFPKMVERYVALAYPKAKFNPGAAVSAPSLTIPRALHRKTLAKFSLNLQRPRLLLSPGAAFGPAKRWPLEYFQEVAAYFTRNKVEVLIIGGPGEVELAATIAAAVPQVHNFVGHTTLLEMAALIAMADVVLANDSGPMHVAAALAKPMVAIFGSSSTIFTPPLSPKALVLERLNLPCRPCFQRECPLKHLNCLKDISPAEVIAALKQKFA